MTTTLNVLDTDLIKNKVLTPKELKDYSELVIGYSEGNEKWLFKYAIQDKICKAIDNGTVTVQEKSISVPKQAHSIRGAN